MRTTWSVLAVIVVTLITAVGCTRQITGTAQPDPRKPGVVLTKDGYGIVAGFDDAPVRVEIFTEPQCSRCADLQADFGDELARYLNIGQLAVTYRPLTFLDELPSGHSARVTSALFAAADPESVGEGVPELRRGAVGAAGPSGAGPSNDEIADRAKCVRLPVAGRRRAGGESDVDVGDMDDANFEYLFDMNQVETGTPTVYDPAQTR